MDKWYPFGFNVYCGWVLFAVLALLPLVLDKLYPIIRLLCWLGPTALALDVDAGNRTYIYVGKLVIWVLMEFFALGILSLTNGFTRRHDLISEQWAYPVMAALFFLSCTLTVIGHLTRSKICLKKLSIMQRLHYIRLVDPEAEERPYADYANKTIRTPLSPHHLNAVRIFSDDDVESASEAKKHDYVLQTSFLTQFVVTRTFLQPNNNVFVYSPIAHYRTIVLTIAICLAGLYHVVEILLLGKPESDVTQEVLLWLTLPTITIPALVRLKFGSNARFDLLLRGLLPVETDLQMWKRLGISREGFYTALANADTAHNIMKEQIGIAKSRTSSSKSGIRGTVHVTDLTVAKKLVKNSLLQMGNDHVRISDGIKYVNFMPGEVEGIMVDVKPWWEAINNPILDGVVGDWSTAISNFDLSYNCKSKES